MKRVALFLGVVLAVCFPFHSAKAELPAHQIDLSHVRAAILYEPQTGTAIVEHCADEQLQCAGLMRMPTLLALAEAFDDGGLLENAVMQVDRTAAKLGGPTAFLEEGEQIVAGELMKAGVIIGAGDAIVSLIENAFGSRQVAQQNILLALSSAGVIRDEYDCLGDGATLSARELAYIASACAKSASYLKYSARYADEILHEDGRSTELVNANRLVRYYAGCSGLMTGSQQQQNYCGAFYATRNNTSFVAVVLGATDAGTRSNVAQALLDYGFDHFRTETLAAAGMVVLPQVQVRAGAEKTVNLIARENATALLPRASGALKETMEAPPYIEAPVLSSRVYGTVIYESESGGVRITVPLYAETDVEAFGLIEILKRILRDYVA